MHLSIQLASIVKTIIVRVKRASVIL